MDYLDYTYLAHHGVKGQKWGVRRYQNEDGTLTEAGKSRRAKLEASSKKLQLKIDRENGKLSKTYRRMPSHYLTEFGKARQGKAIRKAAVSGKKLNSYKAKLDKTEAKLTELNDTKQRPKVDINEKLQRAKEKDLYNMEFLEMVPDHILESNTALLKEYENYLTDPEKWMKK